MSQLVFPLSQIMLLGGLALGFLALLFLVWVKSRAHGTRRALLAAFGLGAFVLGGLATVAGGTIALNCQRIEFALDEPSLVGITRRAEPLSHAIESFTARTGSAPDELDQLVPNYIKAIPDTSWRLHPSFEYSRFQDGKWKLWVETGKFFAWDEFVYDPKVTEPADPGCIDRVGDWYYLHE